VINAWHSYEDVNMFDEAPIIGKLLVLILPSPIHLDLRYVGVEFD